MIARLAAAMTKVRARLSVARCAVGWHPRPPDYELQHVLGARRWLCGRCQRWIVVPTPADLAARNFALMAAAALVLGMLLYHSLGCARPRIPGTAVVAPPLQHEGVWVRVRCTGAASLPQVACCLYTRELEEWRSVCTTDGGGEWELQEGGSMRLEEAPLPPSTEDASTRGEWPCWRLDGGSRVRCV